MRKTKSEQNLKKIFKNSILLENCNKIKSEFTFFAIFFILQIQPDFVGRNRDTDREAGRQTEKSNELNYLWGKTEMVTNLFRYEE